MYRIAPISTIPATELKFIITTIIFKLQHVTSSVSEGFKLAGFSNAFTVITSGGNNENKLILMAMIEY